MRPVELYSLLAIPGTDNPVKLIVTEVADVVPYCGWFEDELGNVVGRLDGFRPAFVGFPPVSSEEREKARSGPVAALRHPGMFVHPFDPRIEWIGDTFELGGYLKGFQGADTSSKVVFRSLARMLDVLLHAHGWSGIAEVAVDGQIVEMVDLFNQEVGLRRSIRIKNPTRREIEITIRPTGRKSQRSFMTQLIIEGFVEYLDTLATPTYSKSVAVNRGGTFHPRFLERLADLPANAVVLDVGGGKRQLADERYINLEYSAYVEPDVLGDGTRLPFRSNCVDLVYTAAVLEHVKDPLAMGREIHRVLKPGGAVVANSAFMQPIHSEGQHFFNLTPYGIDLVFEGFSEKKIWWDTAFAFSIGWFVDVLQVRGKVEEAKLEAFVELAREIDRAIPADRGAYVASGVWVEGVKPG